MSWLATSSSGMVIEAVQGASAASLRYVNSHDAGWRRVRRGRGFAYKTDEGRWVREAAALERIRRLAIPPAWREVWICPSEDGHLQATGLDARGRKQYRYHERWTEHRSRGKFGGLSVFAMLLPRIRRRVRADLGLEGMPKDKVVAAIVRLMDTAHLRVGNKEYARENGSYGLTTIRNSHACVRGAEIRLRFKAKSGKLCDVRVSDAATARIVRRCQDLPGQELFEYVDESGAVRAVNSGDVNEYLGRVSGEQVTAKDFRTWGGTVAAAEVLLSRRGAGERASNGGAKHLEMEALRAAAARLGNTVAVCRKSYVHPRVLEALRLAGRRGASEAYRAKPRRGMSVIEGAVLAMLSVAVESQRRRAA